MARLGIVQYDIAWEDAPGNINRLNKLLADQSERFDLLVLPELWPCGFTMSQTAFHCHDQALDYMKRLSREQACPILGGVPGGIEGGQENRHYLVDGDTTSYYVKNKSFTFAGEHKKYQRGNQTVRWDVAGFKLSPFVCYDLRFPELARAMMPESNMLVYVANWPKVRVQHWRQLLIARAIENLSYVIGVNRVGTDGTGLEYSGNSMVIDPAGEILLEIADGSAGISAVDVDPSYVDEVRTRWPFLNDM